MIVMQCVNHSFLKISLNLQYISSQKIYIFSFVILLLYIKILFYSDPLKYYVFLYSNYVNLSSSYKKN